MVSKESIIVTAKKSTRIDDAPALFDLGGKPWLYESTSSKHRRIHDAVLGNLFFVLGEGENITISNEGDFGHIF